MSVSRDMRSFFILLLSSFTHPCADDPAPAEEDAAAPEAQAPEAAAPEDDGDVMAEEKTETAEVRRGEYLWEFWAYCMIQHLI